MRRFLLLSAMLVVIGIVVTGCGSAATSSTPTPTPTVTVTAAPGSASTTQPTPASTGPVAQLTEAERESSTKEGIHSLQIAVQTYAIDHNDLYPLPVSADELVTMLRPYVDTWPDNPYSGQPMAPAAGGKQTASSVAFGQRSSAGAGEFAYAVSKDRTSYMIVAYGPNHARLITVP